MAANRTKSFDDTFSGGNTRAQIVEKCAVKPFAATNFKKNIVVGRNIFCLRDKFAKSGESFADGRKPNIIINGYSSRTFKIALRRFSRFVAEYEFMSKMYINIFQPRKKVVRFGYSTENK